MNDTIVRNWNSRVQENDIVIFLGDFCFVPPKFMIKGGGVFESERRPYKWLSLLNGYITFIKGNHDHSNSLNTRIIYLYLHIANRPIFCTHNPINCNPKYRINLVGHVHEKWKVQKRYNSYLVNVGVDAWDYHPVDINEILKAINKFKKEQLMDLEFLFLKYTCILSLTLPILLVLTLKRKLNELRFLKRKRIFDRDWRQ